MQNVLILIRCRILWHMTSVYTVCLVPIFGMLDTKLINSFKVIVGKGECVDYKK